MLTLTQIYHFDNFVEGESNKFYCTVAKTIAKDQVQLLLTHYLFMVE